MTAASNLTGQIWPSTRQIWPDFAKSESWPNLQIWNFMINFKRLRVNFQIWLAVLQNLQPNLEFLNEFRSFCQIQI